MVLVPRGLAATVAALAMVVAACGGPGADHPWLSLEDAPPHRIVEVTGNSAGQLVIVMNQDVSPPEVLDLGERIRRQAPPGATVNARIFNDEQTARNWRTAPGEWTVEHLLAVVTVNPETGVSEVRWVRPDPGEEALQTGEAVPGTGATTPSGMPGVTAPSDTAAPGTEPPTPGEPTP